MDIERLIVQYSSEEDSDLVTALAAVTAKVTWEVNDKPFTVNEKIEALEALIIEATGFVLSLTVDLMSQVGDWSDEEERVNRTGLGTVLDFIRYATYAEIVDRRKRMKEADDDGVE